MEFEKVLNKCGDYSRYQFMLLVLFGLINTFSSWHYFAQTIISFTPPHWCYHESLSNLSFVDIEAIYSKFEHPYCTKLIKSDDLGSLVASDEKCTEWIYQYDFGYKSISAEMNWVCDDAYKLAVGQSLFFIGSVIGSILFGLLADRVGRLPAMILSNLSGCIGDFATSYTSSLAAFATCRLISGMATDTCYYLMYIMVFEYIRPSKRTFALNIINAFFYCFGLVVVPWMAILMRNWRSFLILTSIPTVSVGLFIFLLCESAQWLITRKNYDGAVKCLKHIAKFNRRNVDAAVFDDFKKLCQAQDITEIKLNEKQKADSFFGMFRKPYLRKVTCILLIKSMIITISFDIVGKNMEGFGTSPFILFSVTSLVYVPSGLSIILLQNKIGRKGMACISLFMCGVFTMTIACVMAYIDSVENAVLLAILAAMARYGTVVAYDAEAQYAAELIPTSVRGQGMANIHVIGYLFAFLSAYIVYMGSYYKPFPSIFVSVIMFFGAFLCLFLPETVNKTLPSSLSEGEEFGRNEKWFQFPMPSKISAK